MPSPVGNGQVTSPHAAVQALALQVNRDTVLQARAALLAEADRLDDELLSRHNEFAGVGRCGGDPVSPEAAQAFTERINGLVLSCFEYNKSLRVAARVLDATARHYGYTDDEIARSFISR